LPQQQQQQQTGADTDAAAAVAPLQQPQQPSSQQQQQDVLLQQQTDNPLLAAAASSTTRVTTAVLGSLPGVLWHVRRRDESVNGNWPEHPNGSSSASDAGWSVQQYAAAAILSALDPTASMEEAGLPAAAAAAVTGAQPDTSAQGTAAAAEAVVTPDPLERQQQQEQQQDKAELLQRQQQQQLLQVPADFSLIEERVASHAAASTSGRDITPLSNSSSSSSQPALSAVQQQDAQNSFSTSADELQLMQQGPAANFRDPRFEQALSRWIKEAPDWFKVRSVSKGKGINLELRVMRSLADSSGRCFHEERRCPR
jgi:hypothetical protein